LGGDTKIIEEHTAILILFARASPSFKKLDSIYLMESVVRLTMGRITSGSIARIAEVKSSTTRRPIGMGSFIVDLAESHLPRTSCLWMSMSFEKM